MTEAKRLIIGESTHAVEAFVSAIFVELEYGEKSMEEAVRQVARGKSRKTIGGVKQYLRELEERNDDAQQLNLLLKRAADQAGYFVTGDARHFFLDVRMALQRSAKSTATLHRKPQRSER